MAMQAQGVEQMKRERGRGRSCRKGERGEAAEGGMSGRRKLLELYMKRADN